MVLRRVVFSAALIGLAAGSALAQDWTVAPAAGVKTEASAAAKSKGASAKRATSVQHLSPEGDKAARMEENRKKFFGQSSGFDNGRSSDLPISAGTGSNGQFQPGMGFKF